MPTGPWQKPGDIQVPKGIQAVHTTKDQCEERLSVVADALFDFDKSTLRPDAEGRHIEGLGQYLWRRVAEPIGDREGAKFREIAVVEHQNEGAGAWP
ncbi:MAG TPA: hypothetical protein VFJ49_02865 [Methyloceanibacter sp.]|nr:hypothetical protein [Methyloceanibacter sp.]